MNKTLALIAALGLVAAPAFAAPEAPKAEKVVAKEAAKEGEKAAEVAKEGEKAAEAAPAAGKMEEKKAH